MEFICFPSSTRKSTRGRVSPAALFVSRDRNECQIIAVYIYILIYIFVLASHGGDGVYSLPEVDSKVDEGKGRPHRFSLSR